MLLYEITAYLIKAHSLIIHIEGISYLASGILHFGDSIYTSKLTLAVFTEVSLHISILAKLDYILGLAV